MPRLIILPAARSDILEIADYIALDNPSRAQSFVMELESAFEKGASLGCICVIHAASESVTLS